MAAWRHRCLANGGHWFSPWYDVPVCLFSVSPVLESPRIRVEPLKIYYYNYDEFTFTQNTYLLYTFNYIHENLCHIYASLNSIRNSLRNLESCNNCIKAII